MRPFRAPDQDDASDQGLGCRLVRLRDLDAAADDLDEADAFVGLDEALRAEQSGAGQVGFDRLLRHPGLRVPLGGLEVFVAVGPGRRRFAAPIELARIRREEQVESDIALHGPDHRRLGLDLAQPRFDRRPVCLGDEVDLVQDEQIRGLHLVLEGPFEVTSLRQLIRVHDDDGHVVRHGQVIYARMILSGAAKPLYRFELRPGKTDYFDDTGRSAKRPLLRTPIDGARLSSRFGKRRHPILGYTKMHRGVDFAAPTGTPIYAAGDGVIAFRGRKSGYGKYIRIRHAGGFNSAYAHMSRFRKGVTQGSRVKQGQVIGYVGSTGRSTGPHLHYEILARGRQVNPLTIKMPSGIKLGRKDFARFEVKRANIATLVANLQKKTRSRNAETGDPKAAER